MRSFNKTLSIIIFLLINIVCVTNGRFRLFGGLSAKSKETTNSEEESEELTRCKDELYKEFRKKEPLDDFLHAFLNIKYETIKYDYDTKTNEEIFRGYEVLEKSARCYYFELLFTALDMDLPLLPPPRDYCKIEYRKERDECTRQIAATGCKVYHDGIDCLRNLYFHWKKPDDSQCISGFEDISDEELKMAISRASDSFQEISEEELFERVSKYYENFRYYSENEVYGEISGDTFVFPDLKDDDLLKDFNDAYGNGPVDRRLADPKMDEFRRFYQEREGSNFGSSSFRYDVNNPDSDLNDTESDFNVFMAFMKYSRERHHQRRLHSEEFPSMEYTDFRGGVTKYNPKTFQRFVQFMNGEREYKIARAEFRELCNNHLYEAQYRRYGIRGISFSYICKEYNRRQNTPKKIRQFVCNAHP